MSTRRSLLERADHLRHYREHFTVIFGETGSPAALLPGSVPRPVVQRLGAAAAATPAPAAPLRVTARLKYPAEAELLAEAEAFGVPSGMPAPAWTGNGEVVAKANPAALPQTHWTQTHESQLHEPQPNLTPSDLAALSVATPNPAAPPHWQSPPLPPLDERQVVWVDPGRPALYAQPDIQPPPPVWPSEPMSQPPPERSTQTGQLSFRELMTFTGAAATGSAPFVSPPVDPSAAFQSESGSTAPGVGQLENGEPNLTPPANLTQSSAAGLETVQANAAPTGPSQPSAALPGDVPLLAQDTGQTRETPPIVSGANASSTQAAAARPGQLGPAPTLAAPQAQALASEVQQPLPLGAEPDRAPDARQEESDSVAPAELVLPTEQPQPTISLGAASANAAALLNTATTFSEALATADPQSAPSSTATAAVTPGPERQTATPEPAPQPIAASVSTSETSGPMDAVAARPAQPAMTERMATSTTQMATNDLPNSASQAPKAEHAAPAPSARALAPEQRQSAPATPARLDTASSAPEQQADKPALAAPPSAPAQGQPALSAPASETALPAQPPSALNPAPGVGPASDGVEPERAANVMPSMQEAQAFSADNPAVPAQEQDAVSAPASEQPRSETESFIAAAQSLAADAPLTPVQAAQPAASLSVTPAPQPASSDTAAEQDTGPALIDRPAGFVPMGDDPETMRKLREHLPPSHPGVGLKLPRRPRPVALQPSVPKEDPAAAIPVQSPEQVRSVLERLNRVIEAEGEEGGDARPMSLAEILSWQRPASAAPAAPSAVALPEQAALQESLAIEERDAQETVENGPERSGVQNESSQAAALPTRPDPIPVSPTAPTPAPLAAAPPLPAAPAPTPEQTANRTDPVRPKVVAIAKNRAGTGEANQPTPPAAGSAADPQALLPVNPPAAMEAVPNAVLPDGPAAVANAAVATPLATRPVGSVEPGDTQTQAEPAAPERLDQPLGKPSRPESAASEVASAPVSASAEVGAESDGQPGEISAQPQPGQATHYPSARLQAAGPADIQQPRREGDPVSSAAALSAQTPEPTTPPVTNVPVERPPQPTKQAGQMALAGETAQTPSGPDTNTPEQPLAAAVPAQITSEQAEVAAQVTEPSGSALDMPGTSSPDSPVARPQRPTDAPEEASTLPRVASQEQSVDTEQPVDMSAALLRAAMLPGMPSQSERPAGTQSTIEATSDAAASATPPVSTPSPEQGERLSADSLPSAAMPQEAVLTVAAVQSQFPQTAPPEVQNEAAMAIPAPLDAAALSPLVQPSGAVAPGEAAAATIQPVPTSTVSSDIEPSAPGPDTSAALLVRATAATPATARDEVQLQPPSARTPAPDASSASDVSEPERAANVPPATQKAQQSPAPRPAMPPQEQNALSAQASDGGAELSSPESLVAESASDPFQATPSTTAPPDTAEQDTGPALIDRPAGFVPMGDDPETMRKLREHLPPSHPGVGLKLPRRPRPVALQPSVPKEDPAAAIPVQSPEQVRSVLERLNRVIEAEGEEGGDARPMSLAEILSWQRPATAASAAPEAAQVGPETGIMQAATPNVNPPNLNPEPRAVQNASSLQPGSLQPSSLQPSQFAALPTPPESAPALPAEQTADLSASPLPSGNLGQASQSAAPEGQTELSELASVPHPGALSTQQTDARQVQLRPTAPDSGSSLGAPLEPQVRPLDSGPPQPRPLNFPGAPVPGANAALSRAQPNRGVGNPPLPSVQSQNTAQIISSRLPARSTPPEQKAKGQTEQRPLTVQSAVEQGSVPSVNLAPQTNAASQTPSAESPAQPQFTAPLSPSAASAAPRSLSASPAAQPSSTQPLSASPLATPPWSAGDQAHQTAPGINLAPPQINAAPGAYGSEARTGLEAALPVSPAPAPEAPRSLSALAAAQATPPGANSPAPTAERVFGSSPSPAVPSVPAVQTDAAPGQQVNAPQAMSKPASTPNLPVSPPDQSLPLSAASGLGNEMASAQIHSDQIHSDQMNAGQVRQQLASPAQTSQAPSIQSSVPDLHILDSQPENAAQVRAERRQSDTVESSPAVQQPPMTAATALGQALRTRPEDGATSQADAQPPAITSPSDAEPAPEVPAPKAVARPLFKPNWSGQPKSAAQPANPQPGAKDGQFAPKAGGDAGAVAANPRPTTATSPQRPMTQAQQRLEQALASPQAREPLPLSVRSRLTPLLGQDPGEVHLIRNAHATAATAAAAADALTVGDAVLLSPGQDLASPRGLGLLAHELTHVLRGRDPGFVPALVRRVPGRPEVLAAARLDEEQLAEHVEGQVQSEMTRGAALPGRGIPTAPAVAATPSPWGGLPAPWEKLPFWEAPSPGAETAAAWPTAPQAQTPLQSAAPRPRSAAAPARLSSAPAASAAPQAQAASTSRSVDSSPPEMRGPAVATDHRKTNRKAPDLDRLAQQVYSLIKRRLSTEVRRDR